MAVPFLAGAGADDSIDGKMIRDVARLVGEKTRGKIKVQSIHGGVLAQIAGACEATGKEAGFLAFTPEEAIALREIGSRCIA